MKKPVLFLLKQLHHMEHVFTEAEVDSLQRQGTFASAMECGDLAPRNKRYRHFVDVCHQKLAPQTEFEFLWLQYRRNCRVDQQLANLEDAQRKVGSFELGILREVAKRKQACDSYAKQVITLQTQILKYEAQLGIKRDPADPEPFLEEWREQA